MDPEAVRAALAGVVQEVSDDDGQVIGRVCTRARFKIERPYLSRGGFLIVDFDEQTGEYVASEWDALRDEKSGRLYPAGLCVGATWRAGSLEQATKAVLADVRRQTPSE